MKRTLLASACSLALSTYALAPAYGQSATAVGVGTGIAKSRSDSSATAIGGGVGNAGTIAPSASITTNGAPLVNQQTTVPANQSVKTVPSVFAPGLAAAGIESCLGSVSGGGSWLGTGITLGGTVPDGSCSARLDARTLWAFGLRKAAVARLCLNADIYRSMPEVCVAYVPQPQGYAAPVAYAPAYASADRGIMLVDGKTGVEHLCLDYAEARQKCRQWADASPPKPKRVAAKRRHQDPIAPTVAEAKPEDQTK